MTGRNRWPSVTPASDVHASIAFFVHAPGTIHHNTHLHFSPAKNPADTGGTMIPSQTVSLSISPLVAGDNVFALRLKDNEVFYISTSYVLSVS
jgi:hypothetical protein